jgi:hypothetical protein
VGTHTVTVAVTDAAGNEAIDEIVLEIAGRTSPTRATAQIEPRAVEYFNTFQCIPDSASQAVADTCAEAAATR